MIKKMFHVFCFVFLAGISCYFLFLYFFALIHLSQEAFPRPGNSASSSPVRPVFPHFSLPLVSLVNIVAFELWTQSTKWSFYWVPRSGGGGEIEGQALDLLVAGWVSQEAIPEIECEVEDV